MSGSVPAVGSSASSAARTPQSPIAWTIVAIPTAWAFVASAASRSGGVMKTPRSGAGRERPSLLRLDRLEERRRPRRERAVGKELQPAEMGAAGLRPERIAAPQPCR